MGKPLYKRPCFFILCQNVCDFFTFMLVSYVHFWRNVFELCMCSSVLMSAYPTASEGLLPAQAVLSPVSQQHVSILRNKILLSNMYHAHMQKHFIISQSEYFPVWIFPSVNISQSEYFPEWIFPRVNISQSEYFPEWIFPSVNISQCEYFPVWIFPSVNISQSEYFPVWIFPSVNISQCEYFPVWIFPSVNISQCEYFPEVKWLTITLFTYPAVSNSWNETRLIREQQDTVCMYNKNTFKTDPISFNS